MGIAFRRAEVFPFLTLLLPNPSTVFLGCQAGPGGQSKTSPTSTARYAYLGSGSSSSGDPTVTNRLVAVPGAKVPHGRWGASRRMWSLTLSP